MIIYGAVRLIGYGADWLSSRQTTRELREIAAETEALKDPVLSAAPETALPVREAEMVSASASDEPEEEPLQSETLPVVEYPNGYELVSRIRNLRKKSEYIVGWITMDEIDEPVAQKDNTFFLNHDATGKKIGPGAPYRARRHGLLPLRHGSLYPRHEGISGRQKR